LPQGAARRQQKQIGKNFAGNQTVFSDRTIVTRMPGRLSSVVIAVERRLRRRSSAAKPPGFLFPAMAPNPVRGLGAFSFLPQRARNYNVRLIFRVGIQSLG
jgi:hypothetical protein